MPFTSPSHHRSSPRLLVALALTLTSLACSDGIVSIGSDGQSRVIEVVVGQEIDVTLGNVGPAEYQSPPVISSPVVTYLGVDVVPPFNPGGPTQRFRLRAVGAGSAIVDFRRAFGDSVVSSVTYTVRVR